MSEYLRSKASEPNNKNDHLLDIDEAAEHLSISSHTVRALVSQRKITFVKLGARVLFRPQDLEDFIQFHLVQSQFGPQGEKE